MPSSSSRPTAAVPAATRRRRRWKQKQGHQQRAGDGNGGDNDGATFLLVSLTFSVTLCCAYKISFAAEDLGASLIRKLESDVARKNYLEMIQSEKVALQVKELRKKRSCAVVFFLVPRPSC